MENYYEVLEIEDDATPKEIKMAYSKLARKYHPDINSSSSAEELMYLISEAFDILNDEDEREKYDEYLISGSNEMFSVWKDERNRESFNRNQQSQNKPYTPPANKSVESGSGKGWLWLLLFLLLFVFII